MKNPLAQNASVNKYAMQLFDLKYLIKYKIIYYFLLFVYKILKKKKRIEVCHEIIHNIEKFAHAQQIRIYKLK